MEDGVIGVGSWEQVFWKGPHPLMHLLIRMVYQGGGGLPSGPPPTWALTGASRPHLASLRSRGSWLLTQIAHLARIPDPNPPPASWDGQLVAYKEGQRSKDMAGKRQAWACEMICKV